MNTAADLPIGTLVKFRTGKQVWMVEDTSADSIYEGLSFEFVTLRAALQVQEGYVTRPWLKRRLVTGEKIERLVIVEGGMR